MVNLFKLPQYATKGNSFQSLTLPNKDQQRVRFKVLLHQWCTDMASDLWELVSKVFDHPTISNNPRTKSFLMVKRTSKWGNILIMIKCTSFMPSEHFYIYDQTCCAYNPTQSHLVAMQCWCKQQCFYWKECMRMLLIGIQLSETRQLERKINWKEPEWLLDCWTYSAIKE